MPVLILGQNALVQRPKRVISSARVRISGQLLPRQRLRACHGLTVTCQLQEEGERLVKDRVGGDLLLSLLAQLRFPLPVPAMQAAGMYGHVFVNTGNLVQLTSQGDASGSPHPLEQGLKAFGRSFRWSAVRHS